MTPLHIPVATDRRWRLPFSPVAPYAPATHKVARYESYLLPSGRTITVSQFLTGGCVGCYYPDGDTVSLTLAFLRKFGRPA